MFGITPEQLGIVLTEAQKQVLWSGGALLVVFSAAGWGVLYLRRRVVSRRSVGKDDGKMTLEKLEALYRAKDISEEEFRLLRGRLWKIPFPEKENRTPSVKSDSIISGSTPESSEKCAGSEEHDAGVDRSGNGGG